MSYIPTGPRGPVPWRYAPITWVAIIVTSLTAMVIAAACNQVPPLLPAPLDRSEDSTVAILKPRTEWPSMGESFESPEIVYATACSGVAIGQDLIVTAAHCLDDNVSGRQPRRRDRVGYVTREDWFRHTDLVDYGRVEAVGPGDMLTVKTGDPLPKWAFVRAPTEGEHVTIVSALGDYSKHECHVANVRGSSFVIYTKLQPGMSGSPAFGDDGAALGYALACPARDGQCTGPGEFQAIGGL